MTNIYYYDFETTGLNPFHNKIIEYCFMNSKEQYIQNLVDPGFHITENISKITSITNEMLQGKPSIIDNKQKIVEFLNMYNSECIYIIAHNNCNFDRFFFKNIFKDDILWYSILSNKVKYIDTIHIAKYILSHRKQYSLAALCKYFNIIPGTHRAYSDTVALKKLFEKLVVLLSEKESIDYQKLMDNPEIIYNIIY